MYTIGIKAIFLILARHTTGLISGMIFHPLFCVTTPVTGISKEMRSDSNSIS